MAQFSKVWSKIILLCGISKFITASFIIFKEGDKSSSRTSFLFPNNIPVATPFWG
nr:MAG TPA: hypothetical protein [Caudoviricetes sp.]DAM56220.1 MAG TPA: hypothetical protein [Caudoviricetes sp.]